VWHRCVVGDEVSLVDVMPTILQALNIPVPSSVQGKSLLSLVRGGHTPDADVYAESYFPLLRFGWSPLRSLQWRGLKYVETSRPELYDTRTDPRELNDVLDTHQALAGEMRDRLHRLVRRFTPAGNDSAAANQPADHALAEALRSLGYVAVSAGTITDAAGRTLPDPKDRIQVYESVSAAMVEGQHGRYEESLRRLREAEKTEHKSPTIHFLMARDYYRLNDFPQAARYFQSAFELNPKDSVAAYYLGLSRLELGDLDSAENSFRRALEIDPANFSAAFNLGVVYSRRRQPDAAIQAFQRAVTIFPEYADAHEALGEPYLYLERPDDAVRELERAVAIAPGMRKAHYHLGRAYEAKGLQEKAVQEFNRAKSP
jgi:tetratricopeptide (TPR) repeat protein